MDFVSVDVSDKRAPKGLTCPNITAVPKDERSIEGCPLCDSPRTLGIIQEKQAEGQGLSTNSTGISAVKPRESSMDRTTTDSADRPAGRERNDSEGSEIRRRAERPETTTIEEPASTMAGGSEDWPTLIIESQKLAISSADRRRAKCPRIQGHKRSDCISINNLDDYRSSRGSDMFLNYSNFWD